MLHDVWDIETNFTGHYWDDYKVVKGEESVRSLWCDKYTTVIFRNGDDWRGDPQQRMHHQPLPDYMRWLESGGELHYLPHEARTSLKIGVCHGRTLFRLVFVIVIDIKVNMMSQVALAVPTGNLLTGHEFPFSGV